MLYMLALNQLRKVEHAVNYVCFITSPSAAKILTVGAKTVKTKIMRLFCIKKRLKIPLSWQYFDHL